MPVELGLAQVDWDNSLPYRDAYFAGGTAGFSFGPLISLRGFYYRGMTDEDINFDFDDISLYGADFRFNLTQASSGIVPLPQRRGVDVSTSMTAIMMASRRGAIFPPARTSHPAVGVFTSNSGNGSD